MSQAIWERMRQRLAFCYGAERAGGILEGIRERIGRHEGELAGRRAGWAKRLGGRRWDASDAMLITYGDSIVEEGRAPLRVLDGFLRKQVKDLVPWVHLLPFYPWTSDDGFAVTDFRKVNPSVGSWGDVEAMGETYRLVFDGVINHVSSESVYAKGYLAGDPAFADFFIALPPETDTSAVLRTRNLPLLHDYETASGKKWLWTTFSRDQLDLNFSNPAVLLEIIDVLLFYAARGAGVIRLDAIPYLWKQLGTKCAHLPQTHELIKLFRDVYDVAAPWMILLTETNNPHQENVTYFGDRGDEAQMIYNFTLAPLILHAIVTGNAGVLSAWAKQIVSISDHATYLNITATHDGIGMRPTEGILPESDRKMLVDRAYAHGGAMTGKRNSDGSVSPYEINVNYFDAVNDPNAKEPLELQIKRFMLSQAIPLAFMGIPGIYIHSLLGSRNDLEGVKRTGRARSINREQLRLGALEAEIGDPKSLRHKVFGEYLRLLGIRRGQAAFHPGAGQEILELGEGIFALRRTSASQAVTAIYNISGTGKTVTVGRDLAVWRDLVSGESGAGGRVEVVPYQFRWLVSGR